MTGDSETQANGAVKPVEGKIQNALGKVKDRVKNASERTGNDLEIEAEDKQSTNPRPPRKVIHSPIDVAGRVS